MDPPLQQIQKMQLLLLKHDIHLFPQGFENSDEKIQELIQIINDDKDFNDNLQCEVDKFLSLDAQQFKQVLNYDAHFQIYKEYDDKLVEYNKFQEKIKEAQKKIAETQKDIPNFQAYIHNNLIRDQDRVQILEDVFVQLNQIKAQAIQEIYNLDKRNISEVKAFSNPPQAVAKVAEMIVLLCNNTATQNNSWTQFKRLIANPNEFTTKLIQFKIEDVNQSPLRVARQVFQNLDADQCNRCSQCAYVLYKWAQYQFQVVDILSTYETGIEELLKHKKALKLLESIQEIKDKINSIDQTVQELKTYKQPQILEKEDKAIQVITTVKWFDQLKAIIKPKQYGIKITNFLIKFLQQLQCQTQIDILIEEIMTNLFANYTILYDETPQQPYQYPIKLNNYLTNNVNIDVVAKEIVILLKSPLQFYNNLKQLNCLIDQATLLEEIHSLVYQIYFNIQRYSEPFLQDILQLFHQFIVMIPNQTEFTVHSIMKILNVNKSEREAIIGIITHIKEKSKINIQHQKQLQFQGITLIDYLINSYLEDNQNKNKLKFNEQQMEAIKDIILNQKLEIDETVQNIIENYDIIYKSKEQYNEVSKGIVYIKFKIQENKEQIVILKNLTLEYTEFSNKLQVPYQELLKEKQCLENQLKILKDKDVIIKEQLDKSKKILNRPIHHGIKNYDIGFFKSLQKFNPISYFASKITLIQLGINSFTPDMIKKHLGSHSSLKKLTNLTINKLTTDQYHYLSQLLLDFNQNNSLQKFQNKAIQNLIKRPFRIFYLSQLLDKNNQKFVQRTDLLQKQRVIKNKISIINQMKQDLDQQVLSALVERIKQIRKEIEIREDADNQTSRNVDQFNDIQELQEFISEFESFDTINLCIQLIHQNFTSKVQQELQLLTQIQFQQIPKGLLIEQSRFNLLLMYLQEQYNNNLEELKSIYENKGIFYQFKQQIVVDALTYWRYYNKVAKTNINILIGIYSYQLFYNDFGQQVQAICIKSDNYLIENQSNTNYQIRVLYEILHIKYGSFTLSVILQFLKQVLTIKQKISNIYDILNHQINIDSEKEIEFKEFQKEVQEMLNCQIKEFVI